MKRLLKALARRILGKELKSLRLALDREVLDNDKLRARLNAPSVLPSPVVLALRHQVNTLQEELSARPSIVEYRITKEFYKQNILAKLPPVMVNSSVTPVQANVMLGIQQALRVIEEHVQ